MLSLAEQVARAIHPDARQNSRGWWEVGHICHNPERATASRTERKLGIMDDPNRKGWLRVKCFASCDRRRVIDRLEAVSGVRIRVSRRDRDALGPPPARSKPRPKPKPEPDYSEPRALWQAGYRMESPPPGHAPPVRWAMTKERHGPIWPLGWGWPPAVRWLRKRDFWELSRQRQPPLVWRKARSGGLVMAFAPLRDWLKADILPAPTAVQVIFVADDGQPAMDADGLKKRSKKGKDATMKGAVGLLWRGSKPSPTDCTLHVCEGLADGLRVLSAHPDDFVAVLGGTATLEADSLNRFARTMIWSDGDPPGRRHARRQARRLRRRYGLDVRAICPAEGYDPADAPTLPRLCGVCGFLAPNFECWACSTDACPVCERQGGSPDCWACAPGSGPRSQ